MVTLFKCHFLCCLPYTCVSVMSKSTDSNIFRIRERGKSNRTSNSQCNSDKMMRVIMFIKFLDHKWLGKCLTVNAYYIQPTKQCG